MPVGPYCALALLRTCIHSVATLGCVQRCRSSSLSLHASDLVDGAILARVATTEIDVAVPARDLPKHYGRLLERAAAGESIDIERDGRLVATLGPLRRPTGTPRARLVEVFEHVEPVDVDAFLDDVYGDRGFDDGFSDSEAGRQ